MCWVGYSTNLITPNPLAGFLDKGWGDASWGSGSADPLTCAWSEGAWALGLASCPHRDPPFQCGQTPPPAQGLPHPHCCQNPTHLKLLLLDMRPTGMALFCTPALGQYHPCDTLIPSYVKLKRVFPWGQSHALHIFLSVFLVRAFWLGTAAPQWQGSSPPSETLLHLLTLALPASQVPSQEF